MLLYHNFQVMQNQKQIKACVLTRGNANTNWTSKCTTDNGCMQTAALSLLNLLYDDGRPSSNYTSKSIGSVGKTYQIPSLKINK